MDSKPFLLFYFHSLHYMITLCITDLHVGQHISNELHCLNGGRKGECCHSAAQYDFLLSSPESTGGMCLQLEQALQRYSIGQTARASSHCPAGMFLLRGNITSIEEITVLLLGLPVGTIRTSAKWHPLSHQTHTFALRSVWHYLLPTFHKHSLTRFICWIWTGYKGLKCFLLPLLISQVILHDRKWL